MRLSDAAALTALLGRLSRAPTAHPGSNVVEEKALRTAEGVEFDLYLPRRSVRTAAVALHGVTVNSRHDARLVHFARALAATGAACAVPTMQYISGCQWDARDLDAIESVHRAVRDRGLPAPGIIGFSYGASYGLVAASRPSMAPHVAFVLAFGACFSFSDVFAHYVATSGVEPRTETEWDDRIYLHAVIARGLQGKVELPEAALDAVNAILPRYCHEATAGEKRGLYQRHLRQLDLPRLGVDRWDADVLRALSPEGKMHRIACPVSLIHDSHDSVVPAEQARLIYQELERSGRHQDHRLLVTPLLSHVTLADALRVTDLVGLLRALGPIVRGASRGER